MAAAGHGYIAKVYANGGVFQDTKAGDWKIQIAAVPEPGVWLMMASGIILLGWMRVRKSAQMA